MSACSCTSDKICTVCSYDNPGDVRNYLPLLEEILAALRRIEDKLSGNNY